MKEKEQLQDRKQLHMSLTIGRTICSLGVAARVMRHRTQLNESGCDRFESRKKAEVEERGGMRETNATCT